MIAEHDLAGPLPCWPLGIRPCVFTTLTAPSFGPVHSRRMRGTTVLPCRPRRDAKVRVCPHGRDISCPRRHGENDPRLGRALHPDCYGCLRGRVPPSGPAGHGGFLRLGALVGRGDLIAGANQGRAHGQAHPAQASKSNLLHTCPLTPRSSAEPQKTVPPGLQLRLCQMSVPADVAGAMNQHEGRHGLRRWSCAQRLRPPPGEAGPEAAVAAGAGVLWVVGALLAVCLDQALDELVDVARLG